LIEIAALEVVAEDNCRLAIGRAYRNSLSDYWTRVRGEKFDGDG
jgi:hypothetical protein